MVDFQRLLILALTLTPVRKIGVTSTETLCLAGTSVDLTEETPHFSGFVAKKGEVYLPKATWNMGRKRFGCSCGFVNKKCLRLCCPFDQVQIEGSCVRHTMNLPQIRVSTNNSKLEKIVSETDFLLHNDDPCNFGWMTSTVSENFSVLENGSIYDPDLGRKSLSDFEHYCLFRKPRSSYFSAKICRPWVTRSSSYWDVVCLTVSTLVMITIFVAYTVVPELHNLNGMMFRSYLASYVLTYLCAMAVELTAQSEDNAGAFDLFLYAMEYWGVSCIFWLNAMSFDIWRAVRCLRSIESHNQELKRKKYIRYAVYAWLSPAILITSYAVAMHHVPRLQDVFVRQTFRKFSRIGAKSSIFICNTIFYLMTALTLKRHKKDTANLADGVNKHHDADKQWINLHVKLYLIMGGHMIPWITWDLWPQPATTTSLLVLEMLQSFFLFYTFLWKDNIKRSLSQRFSQGLFLKKRPASLYFNNSSSGCEITRGNARMNNGE